MTKILKKLLILIILVIILLNAFSNVIHAAVEVKIDKALLEKIGDIDYHLKYYRAEDKEYRYLKCGIVGFYDKEGNFNPSYCLNRDLVGVEDTPYSVTVEGLLENNKVWRVIKNGYPYKTASELGLSSYKDAYAVTKWAVYCVLGQSNIKYYKAEEDDAEAVAMLKALKQLVNKGENGTGVQNKDPLSISKVGGFVEDGEYYSQEYKVSSTTAFSTYKISDTNGIPKGGYVSNISGQKTTKFKNGENFKVMVPKDTLSKDVNLETKIEAECKSYLILEGKTSLSGRQNYVLTTGEFATSNKTATLKEITNTGKIKINKTDSETSEPIPGVEFILKDSNGKVVSKATTDDKGVANFTGLYQGKYKLEEAKANNNYVITQAEFDVDVEYNKTTVFDLQNDHKKGNLKIYKVDEDNNNIGLGNVEFELYSEEQKKVIGTYATDVNGEIYIENLRTGKYTLKEKNTNKWYNLVEGLEIEVKWKQDEPQTEIIVKNELKKGQLKVIKVDKDNNEIKLPGVTFNVMKEDGQVLETITTDENGEAKTDRYSIRDYQKIKLQEVSTKEEYKLNDEIFTIQLKENEVSTIQIENEVKKGKIKVIKVDKDNNNIKLAGVEFEIYDEEGKIVDTLITDENGEAVTKDLPITSKYTIKETKTGENYNLNKKTVEIELKQDEVKEIKFENEKKKGKIKVIKVDKENHEIKLEGVEFNILNSKKEIVDTIKTNKNGEAITKELPIDEIYTVQEIKTLENYVLTDETQVIELKNDKISELTFENKKIQGRIKVIKTSKDNNILTNEKAGTPLEGVEFEVYDKNKNIVEKIVTDKNGIAQTSKLDKGLYFIKEISTKIGYLLNDKTYEVEITKDEQTVTLPITNESEKPEVDIEKTGPETANAGDTIEYDISVRNTGNTPLNDFYWKDIIPKDYIKVTEFETGTYNQDLKYNLYYKTNLNENKYILMMEDLSTLENYKIDFSKELADNEYITELKLEFGAIDVGFASNDNPNITSIVKEKVKNGDVFENVAKVFGTYNKYDVTDTSKWKTKIIKILPVTGF